MEQSSSGVAEKGKPTSQKALPSLSTFVPFLELDPFFTSFLAFLDVFAGRSSPLELSLATKLALRLPILLVVQSCDDVSRLAEKVGTRTGVVQWRKWVDF